MNSTILCFDNIITLLTECTRTLELRHSLYLDLLTTDPTILNEFSQLNSVTGYLLLLGANMFPLTHDDDLLNMYLKCSFMYIYTCVCLVSQCGYNMYLIWSCFNRTVYLLYLYYTNQHTHARMNTHARKHTHTRALTHILAHISTRVWVYVRIRTPDPQCIYIHCWTFPILYHSPEQLTICILSVLLFVCSFCSVP